WCHEGATWVVRGSTKKLTGAFGWYQQMRDAAAAASTARSARTKTLTFRSTAGISWHICLAGVPRPRPEPFARRGRGRGTDRHRRSGRRERHRLLRECTVEVQPFQQPGGTEQEH